MKAIHRTAFGIFAAVIVLFAALAVFVARRTSVMMAEEAERTVKSVVKETTARINQQLLGVETVTRNFAWVVSEHLAEPDSMYRITQKIVENNEFIAGSFIAFEPGFYKARARLYAPCSYVSTNGQVRSLLLQHDYPAQEWYCSTKKDRRARWCEPYLDENLGGKMCTFSIPLTNETGEVYAVLGTTISLARMTEHVSTICPYPQSYAVMTSHAGNYLVMPPQGQTFERGEETITIREKTDNGWVVAVVCPMEKILSGAHELVSFVVAFSAVGLLIIIIGSWIHSTRIQRESALRERMANELDIARQIQVEIVPKEFPVHLHAALIPFRGVGGDVYDFIRRDGRTYLLIGDASGSGIPAAIFSFVARMAFRTVCGTEDDPGRILARINDTLFRGNGQDLFLTAFVGVFDETSGELRYCCAGQNPPVAVEPDGTVRVLEARHQAPLGVSDTTTYEAQVEAVGKGAKILVFTDGIVRRERADRACFGEERLLAFLSGCGASSVSETVGGLLKAQDDFAGGAEQTDDIAVVAFGH